MNSNKYTIDRIDEGIVVLLKKSLEEEQLLIPLEQINSVVKEGDIVLVINRTDELGYDITVLDEETSLIKDQVENLINKLRNK